MHIVHLRKACTQLPTLISISSNSSIPPSALTKPLAIEMEPVGTAFQNGNGRHNSFLSHVAKLILEKLGEFEYEYGESERSSKDKPREREEMGERSE